MLRIVHLLQRWRMPPRYPCIVPPSVRGSQPSLSANAERTPCCIASLANQLPVFALRVSSADPINQCHRSESTFTIVVADSTGQRVQPNPRLVLQSVSVAHECPGPPVMSVEMGVGEYLAERHSFSIASHQACLAVYAIPRFASFISRRSVRPASTVVCSHGKRCFGLVHIGDARIGSCSRQSVSGRSFGRCVALALLCCSRYSVL